MVDVVVAAMATGEKINVNEIEVAAIVAPHRIRGDVKPNGDIRNDDSAVILDIGAADAELGQTTLKLAEDSRVSAAVRGKQ